MAEEFLRLQNEAIRLIRSLKRITKEDETQLTDHLIKMASMFTVVLDKLGTAREESIASKNELLRHTRGDNLSQGVPHLRSPAGDESRRPAGSNCLPNFSGTVGGIHPQRLHLVGHGSANRSPTDSKGKNSGDRRGQTKRRPTKFESDRKEHRNKAKNKRYENREEFNNPKSNSTMLSEKRRELDDRIELRLLEEAKSQPSLWSTERQERSTSTSLSSLILETVHNNSRAVSGPDSKQQAGRGRFNFNFNLNNSNIVPDDEDITDTGRNNSRILSQTPVERKRRLVLPPPSAN